MSIKKLPLSSSDLKKIADKCKTPFNIYDEAAIIKNAQNFKKAFSWNKGFINYFAIKALPNINIARLMKKIGFGLDCSSMTELKLAEKAGYSNEEIMFSSNDTADEEFKEAYRLGAIINLDDKEHIEALYRAIGTFPKTISFRYNPGNKRSGNAIIGNPVESKYGVRDDEIVNCYRMAKKLGATRFLIHTMIASNELNMDYIVETANMIFNLVKRIKDEANIEIDGVDLGGGIGIPYREEDEAIDLFSLSEKIHALYEKIIVKNGLKPLKIAFECGRMITGPYGYLISKVLHVTHKYKDYVGLDACMADLMRPALYGSYHHITVIGKENNKKDHKYDVTGSLCENNDKFAVDRMLPEIEKDDLIAIHDTGAHGTAMGFNYNGKLRHKEFLLSEDGSLLLIRRDETFDDYIATMIDKPQKIEY